MTISVFACHLYRRRQYRFVVVAALFLVALASPLTVHAQTTGVVNGTVTNGTSDTPVSGLEVTLSRFERQEPESVDVTTITDPDGNYRFEGVDASDGFVHAVSTMYEGVLYSSSMILVNENPVATENLAVYETTTDQSALTISTRALIIAGINLDTGLLSMTDVITVENSGDRTILPDEDGRTLRLTVPGVASQVNLRPGFDFGTASVEGTTVFATSPIRPGTSTPSLDYTIPVSQSDIVVEVSSAYPMASVRILAPEAGNLDGINLTTPDDTLRDGEVVDIGGSRFQVWSNSDEPIPDPLVVTITDLPRLNLERNRLRTVEPAVVASIALLAAAAIAGWIVARRGLALPRPVAVAPAAAATLETRRDELANELRFIEEQHAEQHIDEASYQSERRAILEELRSISRQMRGIGDDE